MVTAASAQHPSIYSRYLTLLASKLPAPPLAVISTGVCGFMCITYIFSLFNPQLTQNWALSPNSLIVEYKGHLLNTYPLVHESLLHLLFNVIILHHMLSEFEVIHGSLHTAIILNTLGAVTGIAYTITEYILVRLGLADKTILDTFILGSSGWVFAFITVHSCLKSINCPTTNIYSSYNIPTIFVPLFYLVLSAILVPNSSFLGHLISIILGLLIFKNIFSKITIPPFQILDRIESLSIFRWAIENIFPSDYFIWTWENEVKNSRYQECDFHSISLPLHHGNVANSIIPAADSSSTPVSVDAGVPHYEGPGEKLGSNL